MTIEELKELQKKIIRKNRICNIVGLFIFLIMLSFSIFIKNNYDSSIQVILMGFVIKLVICITIVVALKNILINKDSIKFSKEFKNVFVLNALKSTFDDLIYTPDDGFDERIVGNTGMINTGDRFSSNDFVFGKYKGIKFEQSDIHIEEEHEDTDSDGHTTTTWVTIFQGRWMIFDFNKKFKANMQVVSSRFSARRILWGKKFSKVKLEDRDFNKKFKVFTDFEHDAFYILTPHFIERLKKLYDELDSPIILCFVDNKLHVGVDNREDSFEYNVLKKINEEEIKENIIKDIKLITDFVDELNLDNDLFKEEV